MIKAHNEYVHCVMKQKTWNMYAMYVNDFIELNYKGCRGIQVTDEFVNVLLYADNIVICADRLSVGDLQKQLDVLEEYCKKWGMIENLAKSKIVVVFRRGGIIKETEKWSYNNQLNIKFWTQLTIC